jgi:hypothetical protein
MSAYQVNFFKTLLRSDGHAHQLSDDQLHTVMKAYAPLDPSKRSVLMERVKARTCWKLAAEMTCLIGRSRSRSRRPVLFSRRRADAARIR